MRIARIALVKPCIDRSGVTANFEMSPAATMFASVLESSPAMPIQSVAKATYLYFVMKLVTAPEPTSPRPPSRPWPYCTSGHGSPVVHASGMSTVKG